jgi:hypothetical protein
MKIEEAIMRLRSYPEFAIVIKAAEEKRPFLLQMDPSKPWEQQTAEAFYRSGQIRGFDVLFTYLTR